MQKNGRFAINYCEQSQARFKEVTSGFKPFDIELGEPGFFVHRGRVKTIWVGLKGVAPSLHSLYQELMKGGEVEQESGSTFVPHITLARVRSYLPERELRGKWRSHLDSQAKQTISAINLFHSELQSSGPVYHVLA